MYDAIVVEIMIAAPGDVEDEIRIIREEIAEWNAVHSARDRIVVLPRHWSTDTTAESGDRAQSIINRQLKNSDALIAVFWGRLGSPTGGYVSGTVEEIERHIDEGKPTGVYFSDRPVALSAVDSRQYEALKRFKESLGARALHETFTEPEEFRKKIRRKLVHLTRDLNSKNLPGNVASDAEPRNVTGISAEAEDLLKEASRDKHGAFVATLSLAGYQVQSNGRQFVNQKDPRSTASMKSAVGELHQKGLVESSVDGLTRLTRSGFEWADRIASSPAILPTDAAISRPDVRVLHWSIGRGPDGAGLVVQNVGDAIALQLEAERLTSEGGYDHSRSLKSLNPGERGSFPSGWETAAVPADIPDERAKSGTYWARLSWSDPSGQSSQGDWVMVEKSRH